MINVEECFDINNVAKSRWKGEDWVLQLSGGTTSKWVKAEPALKLNILARC